MKKYQMAFCFILAVYAQSGMAAISEPIDVAALLKGSDLARGGGDIAGLSWEVSTHSTGSGMDKHTDQKMIVKANQNASLVEVTYPENVKASKMLQVERNMWLSKPGLKKPVAISPRQRFTGQAAIGDVAATNYAKDYAANLVGIEECTGKPCYRLDLKSVNAQSTYARIDYWIAKDTGLAVRAVFLSLGGKPLKSATFSYQNKIKVDGKVIPFVDEMIIKDALTDANTTLVYKNVKIQSIPPAMFNVMNLQ